ncbi:guanine nucleotide exchange protein for ADP-robosylation factor [Dinochytrium kinnereticum]|nr:guanine nucleotide exchange protein for ADP-robosylation factor [Dinochytrium kinnereticum]
MVAKSPDQTRNNSQSNLAGGSSDVFIKLALEQLLNAKESKKLTSLRDAAKQGLASLDNPEPDLACIQTILQPFHLACQSRQVVLAVIAIDCFGKLFTYNYWSHHNVLDPSWEDGDSRSEAGASTGEFDDASTLSGSSVAPSLRRGGTSLATADPRGSHDEDRSSLDSSGESTGGGGIIGQVVDTVCDTFSGGENTDDKVQVQIVKALLAAVSSTDLSSAIHGGVLLRAIRTTYNIFLLSKSANTQIIAQATLTQMVQAVFGRVAKDLANDVQTQAVSDAVSEELVHSPQNSGSIEIKVPSVDGSGDVNSTTQPLKTGEEASLTLRGVGSQDSFNSVTGEAKAADILGSPRKKMDIVTDQYIKDCYLVFRALCKLSMKPIPAPEGATELKSHAMRSKLLSLHLVYTVLSTHIHIFFVPAQVLFPSSQSASTSNVLFIHAVKQYLCLSISRNAVSVVPQVFDISMDIFGKALVGLRTVLKREISVIFTEIIIPIMEARSSITFNQRTSLLKALNRILSDPSAEGGRLLVEIYLNYDCDLEAGARENIWERLINTLGRVMTQHHSADPNATPASLKSGLEPSASKGLIPPAITTATLTSFTKEQVKELYSSTGDYTELKKRGLELLVRGVLKPLVQWCKLKSGQADADVSRKSGEEGGLGSEKQEKEPSLGLVVDGEEPKRISRVREDDPTAFETLKHRKQVLLEGIKRFNFKPKKGIQFLLDSACIPSRTPRDIAVFLLHTEGLNKTMIGEFLGEGEEENIAIMHAFVDEMDFSHVGFVPALRSFLQTFRLPGEAQKIDRFMLKFAERFLQGNPTTFSSADTAYVLAYSVIMLNTDQHNAQVKQRMTKPDFLKNNRGIDEGKDLPPELLEQIFDEIKSNEIVMKDEAMSKAAGGSNNATGSSGTVLSLDLDPNRYRSKKEVAQFAIASETMAMKTEALFNTILKSGSGSGSANSSRMASGVATPSGSLYSSGSGTIQFFSASHFEHVKAMFTLIWMSILTGLSGPLQESDDQETIVIALEGFHCATRIACLFDMELERKAFVSTLSKFTQLGNLSEIRTKNLEAVKTLLLIANEMGNQLGESWKDVVVCVSQLEKLQVLGSDVNQRMSVDAKSATRKEPNTGKRDTRGNLPNEEVVLAASSQSMTLIVDRLFTSSVRLNGTAIVEFVRSLCNVSWDEITTSVLASSETPRMYCLQRLVEISYYNMKRIRVEWSNIWAILGEHFNKVGCHPNAQVCFFALDKLRQLAIKFLELEELPNFKFQKDFLRPFEHVLGNNPDPKIKDMVLSCLQQMIQAKGSKSMKSGWKAMFGAFIKAARESNEQILLLAFDIVKTIFKNHFESVVANLALPDFISCLVEFCKNRKFAKTSLQAVEILRQTIPRIFEMSKTAAGFKILQSSAAASEKTTSELLSSAGATVVLKQPNAPAVGPNPSSMQSPNVIQESSVDDPNFKIWFPILFGLYEVVMTCDLEVRTRGLNYLFDALRAHGSSFSRDSWEVVSKGVLFPIFDDLKLSRVEHSKFANREDMSVWLSTTLIQALRCFVDLYGTYFEALRFCIDQLFELLTVCMTQENETLARIGSTCLHQFIESNISRLDAEIWDRICMTFSHLFRVTTPDALFFDYRAQAPQAPPTVIAPPEHDEEVKPDVEKPVVNGADVSPGVRTSLESNASAVTTLSTGGSGSTNVNVGGIAPLKSGIDSASDPIVPDITGRPRPQKKDFQGIIAKCVLHLLVIQTLQEILATEINGNVPNAISVYRSLTSRHLLVLVDCLERSYRFAAAFNADLDLRMALYKMGFMKQLPNLLKQETTSVSTYVQILIRMYADPDSERISMRSEVERRLIPLSLDILVHFNTLDPDSKRRNVTAWRPVVVAILNALVDLEDEQFKQHIHTFYAPAVGLLLQDPTGAAAPEVRLALHSLLIRVGAVFGICKASDSAVTMGAPNPLLPPPPMKEELGKEGVPIEADDSAGDGLC